MDRRDFIKVSGWTALGLAASGAILSSIDKAGAAPRRIPAEAKERFKSLKGLRIFWGDIHNHCNVTYGHGDLSDALAAAKEQLDFCSVTPHAMWPDIPGANDPRLSWVIDYHTSAFKRLRDGGWAKYVKMVKDANDPSSFLTFLSYECHSMKSGDHVALCYDFDTPLVTCSSVANLKEKLRKYKTYVTPHHMGYITGYRGYNWTEFKDDDPQTPFVEMFSRHGCAECDMGDYDYLHDMGPRIYEGSVQYGLEQGHKFGLMCSTDQHAGYPGSYGDGRIGVFADSPDRDKIWDAMGQRHICGITGDKIKMDFSINGAKQGDVIKSAGKRQIFVNVEAQNHIDYVDIIKNARCIARLNGPFTAAIPTEGIVRAKVKINFGWNREEEYVHWQGMVKVSGGRISDYQTCFRGAAFTSPQPGETEFKTRVNRVLSHDESHVELDMYSSKNPNTMTSATQGIVLDVEMPLDGKITAEFNGQAFTYTLDELLHGAKAHFMRGWLSEAIQFNRAAPESAFTVGTYMVDDTPERDTDYYYVRVRQRDAQWAWSSPIWAER
ncbi:MAG: Tat pathway signal sequence [Bacteroidales bacterium]